jgi:sec-independent protein translocase protein TatA
MRPPGPLEIVLIIVIVLIIFGAGKLPQIFEMAGKGLRALRGGGKKDEEDEPKETTRRKKKKSSSG